MVASDERTQASLQAAAENDKGGPQRMHSKDDRSVRGGCQGKLAPTTLNIAVKSAKQNGAPCA